jgi:hypothetical protein
MYPARRTRPPFLCRVQERAAPKLTLQLLRNKKAYMEVASGACGTDDAVEMFFSWDGPSADAPTNLSCYNSRNALDNIEPAMDCTEDDTDLCAFEYVVPKTRRPHDQPRLAPIAVLPTG